MEFVLSVAFHTTVLGPCFDQKRWSNIETKDVYNVFQDRIQICIENDFKLPYIIVVNIFKIGRFFNFIFCLFCVL